MAKIVHRANERRFHDMGWMSIAASFRQDMPSLDRQQFGSLVTIDDTIVLPAAKGFGMHPQQNLEIINWVLKGALVHENSLGHQDIAYAGDLQLISSGSGILHHEYNYSDSEAVELLQIWILPKEQNTIPHYTALSRPELKWDNRFKTLIVPQLSQLPPCAATPPVNAEQLGILQDAYVAMGYFEAQAQGYYTLQQAINGLYIMVISGTIAITAERLTAKDAMGLTEIETVHFQALTATQLLAIEVPLH